MKITIYKAVPTLLFLFISCFVSAQLVRVQPIDANTRAEIKNFSVFGVKGKTTVKLKDTLEKAEIESYDSIFVIAEGYQGEWLTNVKIPGMNIPVLNMKTMLKPVPSITMADIPVPDDIVVSSVKFWDYRKNVAQDIRIIRPDGTPQATTADMLQNSGYMLVQKSQLGGGSPIIRGFEASRVGIVIDGVRMNNAIYRGSHLQNILRIDNNILSQVELAQGPGNVMYGSDALGGVMHFITPNPQFKPYGDTGLFVTAGAMARYASAASQLSGNFHFNFGGSKVAWLASFSYNQFGDLRQGASGFNNDKEAWKDAYYVTRFNNRDSMLANPSPQKQTATGYEQVDILQKVRFMTGLNTHFINFQYSETNNVPAYGMQNLTDSANGAAIPQNRFTPENPVTNHYTYAEWYYGPEKRLMLAYTLWLVKHQDSAFGAEPHRVKRSTTNYGKITAAWQNIEESRHTRLWQSPIRTDRVEKVQAASINGDFEWVKNKNQVRYGAEMVFNNVSSTASSVFFNGGPSTPIAVPRYPGDGSKMFMLGIYAGYERPLAKYLLLNAGLRVNSFLYQAYFPSNALQGFQLTSFGRTDMGLSGNLGLVYNGPKGWRLTARVAKGFRPPNLDDMARVSLLNPLQRQLVVPNASLSPEETYTGEAGLSKSFKKGMIEATGWYTAYTNAMVLKPTRINGSDSAIYDGTANRVYSLQNTGSAYLYGATVGGRWHFYPGLELNAVVNYTYGHITADSSAPLAHIAPLFGRAGLRWKQEKIDLEFYSLFNGAKKAADYNMISSDNYFDATPGGMPAWYTLNIRGTSPLSDHANITVALENILDQNYRIFSSAISAPGRNLIVTIRARF